MASRDRLLSSIAETTADYRQERSRDMTTEHVGRWIEQFEPDVQIPILEEFDHVLNNTYISLDSVTEFLNSLLENANLTGENPRDFWSNATFLDIQSGGNSQREMLAITNKLLNDKYGLPQDVEVGEDEVFIYLDDGSFTGNRILGDVKRWIECESPQKAQLHIVVIVLHRSGYWYARNRLKEVCEESAKEIDIKWWNAINVEDRLKYTYSSDVLRPTIIPDDPEVKGYVAGMSRKPELRKPGSTGKLKIFSSEAGRGVLEQEFLKAGVRIRTIAPNLGEAQRPLGNSLLEILGFGTLFVTFRNCPNNAPLALWVGDPWYPLFPRITNKEIAWQNLTGILGD